MKWGLLKRILVIPAIFVATILLTVLFLHRTKIEQPDNWPQNIVSRQNAITGRIYISDVETREALFFYHNDQGFIPVDFKKNDDGKWVVTFRRQKTL